jgi:hypothetical protein
MARRSDKGHGIADAEDMAEAEGLPPEVAREIVKDGVEAGVAPHKLQDVAKEAARVDQGDRAESAALGWDAADTPEARRPIVRSQR